MFAKIFIFAKRTGDNAYKNYFCKKGGKMECLTVVAKTKFLWIWTKFRIFAKIYGNRAFYFQPLPLYMIILFFYSDCFPGGVQVAWVEEISNFRENLTRHFRFNPSHSMTILIVYLDRFRWGGIDMSGHLSQKMKLCEYWRNFAKI